MSMGIAHADEKDQGLRLGARVAVDAKAKPKDSAVKATVPRAKVQVRTTQRTPVVRTKAARPAARVKTARPATRVLSLIHI